MFSKFYSTIVIASVVSIVITATIDFKKLMDINKFMVNKDITVFVSSRAFQRSNFIFPGTKWCGAGNLAENYDDLGEDEELDKCCREHDLCPDLMRSNETKHGLKNTAAYTRLHCSCDLKFHKCLHGKATESNQASSTMVGKIYFDGLDTKCYKLEYPIIGCKMANSSHRCIEYLLDNSSTPIWQWFDVPFY